MLGCLEGCKAYAIEKSARVASKFLQIAGLTSPMQYTKVRREDSDSWAAKGQRAEVVVQYEYLMVRVREVSKEKEKQHIYLEKQHIKNLH